MENLDDRYDPDRWMAAGRNLMDFLSGGPEAERYYAAHPELGRRVAEWRNIVCDKATKARKELNEPIGEADVREVWRSITTKPPRI